MSSRERCDRSREARTVPVDEHQLAVSANDDGPAEDLESEVRLRLLEDDYAVLRKHRGDSSLVTCLTVVIANMFRDYRIRMCAGRRSH